MEKKKKSSFSSSIGFVLSAAGSAVGVGNIWRFPYLAAKDGGGLFLILYLALVLTFGFTLLTTDIAIGRRTKQNALNAFGTINKKWKFLGYLTFLVPALIMTYYSVIGGWVTKYAVTYLTLKGNDAAEDGYFTSFITSEVSPVVFMLIFLAITAFVVYRGVEKGIEKFSKLVMPGLILMIIGIAIFSLTLSHTDESGITRTGLQGAAVYFIPNLEGITVKRFLEILLDAMSQLFFSLSVSMGIMITYGSYVKKDANLGRAVNQIEFFDTLVAFLAGMMIVPAVYTFMGTEGMSAGPGLMFVSLPKVFAAMGGFGSVVAIVFFLMVFFAAVTSSVSIMEAVVSSIMDRFHVKREKATLMVTAYALIAGFIVCLGYNLFYFELTLPNGSVGQILDVLDYFSNSFLMPIISVATCILIGWVVKPAFVINEVKENGNKFGRQGMYVVMIRFIAPLLLVILFLQGLGVIRF